MTFGREAFGLKGSFRLPAPSPRHVILNLIQDPLARADAQMGSFCGVQQSLIEQTVEESNFPPTKYQRQSYVQGLGLFRGRSRLCGAGVPCPG